MKFVVPKNGKYYDLIRIPHGHIPVPKAKFWGGLPIPIKGVRDYNTFSCPSCGEPSFFKVNSTCRWCDPPYREFEYKGPSHKDDWKKRRNYEKWRNRWKKIEYAFLPLLVLVGKAWYLESEKPHWTDRVEIEQ